MDIYCVKSTLQYIICGHLLFGGPVGGGGGGFNNQTGPILVHIYPLFNNNLHVKYRINLVHIISCNVDLTQ